jgi:glycerol kinase
LIASAKESEVLATSVSDNGGVYLVPAFAGLGAPWWDSEAKALMCGMSRGTTKAHIVRAALESIAYQVKDLTDLIVKSGIALKALRVDGGPVKNQFLMQFQSDILEIPVNISEIEEASALGAVIMNGFARKKWTTTEEVSALRKNSNSIFPQMPKEKVASLFNGWHKAIKKVME